MFSSRMTSVFAFAALLILCSCATKPVDPALTGPFHRIGNYFLLGQQLPPDIRRVAMLPLTAQDNDHAARTGRDTLRDILFGEISKARLFEVNIVTPEQMQQWTKQPRWKQDEELPADFLIRIKEATGADAILFSQLSYYRPYPPLAIGWRLLLVRTDGQLIWSIDEVFDAGEPAVINSFRRYVLHNERINAEFNQEIRTRPGTLFSTRVTALDWLNSPRQFARYTADAAIETLSRQ